MVFLMGIIALAATGAIAWPLVKRRNEAVDSRESGMGEYKRRMEDLERDLTNGSIPEQEAQMARDEIARQLLTATDETDVGAQDDSHDNAEPSVSASTSGRKDWPRGAAIVCVALIPVLAFFMYFSLSTRDHNSTGTQRTAEGQDTASEFENLLRALEARLAEMPDDEDAWALLARSYESINNHAQAERAWRGLLEANPVHSDGLWFAGVYAAQRGAREEARDYWERLRALYNQDTEDYALISQALGTLDAVQSEERP